MFKVQGVWRALHTGIRVYLKYSGDRDLLMSSCVYMKKWMELKRVRALGFLALVAQPPHDN